jgi:sigma-B regulation protein RsbU (phosphoserine phosphatase)
MTETSPRNIDKLRLKEFKLNTLLEITNAINNNVKAPKLFDIFKYILTNQLGIGRILLFLNNSEQWECVLKHGYKGKVKEFDVIQNLSHIKSITVIESSSNEALGSFDVVIPVYHKSYPLAYLLLGDLDENALKISPIIKNLNFIQTLTNIITVAIENKRLAKETIKQERLNKELELAREMQEFLLPKEFPNTVRYQFSALYLPHRQVGGDYYDFIPLSDQEFAFCIADVSGKGVPAGLLMSNFQASLRVLIKTNSDLQHLVKELNDIVNQNAKGERFITFFIAKYHIANRTLEYVNAAHPHPLLYSNGQVVPLSKGCIGIGMLDHIPTIETETVQVQKNSTIICYTDGVTETVNPEGTQFGEERISEFLQNYYHLPADKLNEKLIEQLNEFKQTEPYADDIALLSGRFF